MNSISSLRNKSFLFLRKDGTVLVRYPDPKDRAGEKMPPASPWYTLVARGGGNYRSPGYFDREARLVAVRPLQEYPLVVNVAFSEVAALTTWRNRATLIGLGTLLAVICSVLLLLALIRQLRRLMNSELSLAENSRKLAEANAQLDSALNSMRQGLLMFDFRKPADHLQ